MALLLALFLVSATAAGPVRAGEDLRYAYHTIPHVITYGGDESLSVERGVFFAPSDHRDAKSPLLQLPFYRVRARGGAESPPLFLLAGGPGGTYFDDVLKRDFLRWVEHYREIGDIVILEQRGASEARPKPACAYPMRVPLDEPIDLGRLGGELRSNVLRCAEVWREAGLELTDFNLVQMARDFDELRRALGYRQFNLKGGSFGSQLGLTILQRHPESVHRAIFYGVEGLDHTYDLPKLVNAQLAKVAAEVAAHPQLGEAVPDLAALLDRTLERLAGEPVTVMLPDPAGGAGTEVVLGRTDVELILWSDALLQGYRDGISRVPALLLAAAAGEFRPLARAKLEFIRQARSLDLMPFAVDCASGRSAGRAEALRRRDAGWVLSPAIVDFHLHAVCDALNLDLGASFRQDAASDVPVLLISGSLDGFTPPEYAAAVSATLPAGHWLLAERGDHDGWEILERFPAVKEAARRFLAGDPLPEDFPTRVELPPLDFVIPEPMLR